VIVAGHARAAEWRHGGFGGILAAAAALVLLAVSLGHPSGPEDGSGGAGAAGPMIARRRMGPGFDGAFRSACASMRWYPVIPLFGAVIPDRPGRRPARWGDAVGQLNAFSPWLAVP